MNRIVTATAALLMGMLLALAAITPSQSHGGLVEATIAIDPELAGANPDDLVAYGNAVCAAVADGWDLLEITRWLAGTPAEYLGASPPWPSRFAQSAAAACDDLD